MKKLTFILCIGLGRLGQALSFTDAIFERLDGPLLEERLTQSPDPSERRLAQLFLSELRFLEGKPHAGAGHLSTLLESCTSEIDGIVDLQSRALSRMACAVGQAEKAGRKPLFFADAVRVEIHSLLEMGLRESSSADDRAYAQARVLGALPRSAGGTFGKALLQWEILLRRKPELKSALFYQAKLRILSNQSEIAEKLLQRLAEEDPSNARLILFRRQPFTAAVRDLADGQLFGIGPILGLTPLAGFLFGVRFYDDALFDSNRRGLLKATYGTKDELAVSFRYEDSASLAPWSPLTLIFSGTFVSRFEDLFSNRYLNARTPIEIDRAGLEFAVRQPIVDDFYLQVGWRWAQTRLFAGPTLGTEPFGVWTATLGVDSTDSRVWKRAGTDASVTGFYGTDFARATRLELWTVKAAHYWPVDLGTVKFEGVFIDGAASPFGAQTRLSGDHKIPGLREGRYWAPSAAVGTVALSVNFWQEAWGELGVHGISLGNSLASLAGLRVGVSGSLQVALGRLRTHSVRLEMGLFGDEFVVMGAGGLQL